MANNYMNFGYVDDKVMKTFANRAKNLTEAKRMLAKVRTRMKTVGQFVLAGTKSRTPVDTGTLRRAWQVGRVEFAASYTSVTVSNNVEYAPFIENGHRTRGGNGWVKGQFMLKDSVDELENKLPEIFDAEIDSYLEELFND